MCDLTSNHVHCISRVSEVWGGGCNIPPAWGLCGVWVISIKTIIDIILSVIICNLYACLIEEKRLSHFLKHQWNYYVLNCICHYLCIAKYILIAHTQSSQVLVSQCISYGGIYATHIYTDTHSDLGTLNCGGSRHKTLRAGCWVEWGGGGRVTAVA